MKPKPPETLSFKDEGFAFRCAKDALNPRTPTMVVIVGGDIHGVFNRAEVAQIGAWFRQAENFLMCERIEEINAEVNDD